MRLPCTPASSGIEPLKSLTEVVDEYKRWRRAKSISPDQSGGLTFGTDRPP